MSVPALRRPKRQQKETKKIKAVDQQLIILTLKNDTKLVITSDALNAIIMTGTVYKCVLCNIEIGAKQKESHKSSLDHKKMLSTHPYIEHLSENLVRQIDKVQCYCTICNVTTSTIFIMRHIQTDEHKDELNRAILRGTTYKPLN